MKYQKQSLNRAKVALKLLHYARYAVYATV